MWRRQPTLHNQTNTHHTHSSSLLQLLSSLIPLSYQSTISPFHSTNSFTLVYFTNRGQLILRVHITNIHSTHSSFIPVAGDHSSLLLIQSLSFYQTLNIPIHFHSISFIKWTHTSISNHSTILFYLSHSILLLFNSPHITHIHSMINELVSGWMDSFLVLWERVDLDGMWLEYSTNRMDWFQVCWYEWFGVMIELRLFLFTVWIEWILVEWFQLSSVSSITDTTTSVFYHSSSISKNERDKRGVHIPYSLLSILSTSTSFPYSLTLTEPQYLKPFAESQIREILIPTHTHTDQCDSDRKRESHNTTLHFIDTSPEEWFHQRQHIPSSLQRRVISLQSIR